MKKIFFSYPHDKNQAFVKKLRKSLIDRGHTVWFDESEIKEGDEWRRKITEGLLDTEATVAFLSKHSVRDEGVCLNEIAIAMSEQSEEALITVLLEPEKEVDAPIFISHIHWLSMEEWHERENARDEQWYSVKVNQLVNVIENPASKDRHQDLEKLRRVLEPMSFNAERASHLTDFVGREWLFENINHWLEKDVDSRVYRIQGGPGIGKTAIATRLCYVPKSSVVSLFMCRHNYTESCNPYHFVKTVAYQLATRLPDYRKLLLAQNAIKKQGKIANYNSYYTLWDELIANHLKAPGGGLIPRQRMVIVVDGLDEATVSNVNEICKLLSDRLKDLPKWLSLMITSRHDAQIVQNFSQYNPVLITEDDPENIADLKLYLNQWLLPLVEKKVLSEPEMAAVFDALLTKSAGSFLYLVKVREGVESGGYDLKNPSEFPKGLNNIYADFFMRHFNIEESDAVWKQYAKPLLSYMLLCPEPLPLDIAQKLLAWDKDDEANDESGVEKQNKTLNSLGNLIKKIPKTSNTYTLDFFHYSLREWLENYDLSVNFFIQPRDHMLLNLTELVWHTYVKAEGVKPRFACEVLPSLILSLLSRDKAKTKALIEKSNTQNPSAILLNLAEILIGRRKEDALKLFKFHIEYAKQCWESSVINFEYLTQLIFGLKKRASIEKQLGNPIGAADCHQQILRYQCRYIIEAEKQSQYIEQMEVDFEAGAEILQDNRYFEEASKYLEEALSLLEGMAQYAKYRIQLLSKQASVFQRLADIKSDAGDVESALKYYLDCLKIRQDLCDQAPEHAECANDLSISFGKLGDIQSRLEDFDAALDYYQQSHKIVKQLCERAPENANYAHNLSVSFNKLGDVQLRLGDEGCALDYYQQSHKIVKYLCARAPENADYVLALSISFNKLGDIQLRLGDGEAALGYYQQSLEIRQDLRARAPENAEYARDLSVSFNQLGDIQLRLGDGEAAIDYYQQSLEIALDLSQRAPDDANYARDLSVSFARLGAMQWRMGDVDAALGYYQQSLEIAQDLSKRSPENADYARDLSVSFEKLGNIQLSLRDDDAALGYYQQSLEIRKDLSQRAPENAEYARNLAISYAKFAQVSKGEVAKDWWKQCYAQFKSMQDRGILAPEDVPLLEKAKKQAYGDG